MYNGHYALALILCKKFPNTSPYIISVGVGVMDVVFGVVAVTGYEGFYRPDVPPSPYGTIGLHCPFSHSLVGSLLISGAYGYATGALVPGFVASWSHFILDWIVHRSDMFLDPITQLVVGGAGLWDKSPTGAFALETLLCLGAGLYAPKDPWTLGTSILLFLSQVTSPNSTPDLYEYILGLDESTRRYLTPILGLSMFLLPGVLMGWSLTRARRRSHQAIE
ncbi:hypothetical protein BJV82DRAFT_661681 [Fennellomyces sp. T-0311]|nr:hypothetical protein BJV82DRAFT_661681 [Fennellomyces sp. T-0311]